MVWQVSDVKGPWESEGGGRAWGGRQGGTWVHGGNFETPVLCGRLRVGVPAQKLTACVARHGSPKFTHATSIASPCPFTTPRPS